jgi:nucleoside-diphosphate-sugar epimerase
LETVILRPPLMYGPGVRANFLALLRWIDRGMPLPFGLIKNRRSMLYVGNLADVIMRCLDAPAAKGQTYLLSDGEDISTPELIERIALLFGHPPRLWPVPVWLLRGLGRLSGRSAAIDRLSGSLVVDSGKIRKDLDWRPPVSCDEGLRATVQWYLAERGKRL